MARYKYTYTERLATEFEIEIPDEISGTEAVEEYVGDHWEQLVEPNIQTHMLDLIESDGEIEPID